MGCDGFGGGARGLLCGTYFVSNLILENLMLVSDDAAISLPWKILQEQKAKKHLSTLYTHIRARACEKPHPPTHRPRSPPRSAIADPTTPPAQNLTFPLYLITLQNSNFWASRAKNSRGRETFFFSLSLSLSFPSLPLQGGSDSRGGRSLPRSSAKVTGRPGG